MWSRRGKPTSAHQQPTEVRQLSSPSSNEDIEFNNSEPRSDGVIETEMEPDTSLNPLFCEYCGETFQRREHRDRHLRRHTGLRPFVCQVCQKSFSRNDTLVRHRSLHGTQHNERPARRPGQACLPCSKSKLRCERGLPCVRCKAKGFKCEYPHSEAGPRTPTSSRDTVDIQSPAASTASECIAVQTDDTTGFGEISLEGWTQDHTTLSDPSTTSTIPADTTFASQLDMQDWHQNSTSASHNDANNGMDTFGMAWNPPMSNVAFPWFLDGLNMTFDLPDFQHDILPLLTPSVSVSNNMEAHPGPESSTQSYLRPIAICSPYTKTCKSFPEPQDSSLQMAGAEIYGHIQHIPQEVSEDLEVFYRSQYQGNPPGIPPRILHAFVELYFEYFDPQFPFLHPSSVENSEIPWTLLLAIAAVGSHYSEIKEADQYNAVLCDLLARAVEVTILEKLMKPDLATVQSVFLLHVIWMFSGSHRDKVVLQHKRNSLATMCWDLITADGQSSKGQQSDPEREWQDWLYWESLLRLGTCVRGLECLGHLFLGTPLIFNLRDRTRQLPCSDSIWQSRNAKDWKAAQAVADTETISTFVSKMTLLELFIDEKNIARQLRSSQLLRSSFTSDQIVRIPDYENPQLEASIDKAAFNGTETLFHVLAILKRLPLEILHSATGWQASKQQMFEAKQEFRRSLQNGNEARKCLWHAASIFKTTRSSRRLACYDALSLTVAMGYIYCYLELSPPKPPATTRPAIVRLDQLHDPADWIENGDDKIVHLTGVGLLDSESRVRLLRDLEMTLCGQIAWKGFCRAFAASFAQLRRGETPTKESTVHVGDE